jgi:hypothetical protein
MAKRIQYHIPKEYDIVTTLADGNCTVIQRFTLAYGNCTVIQYFTLPDGNCTVIQRFTLPDSDCTVIQPLAGKLPGCQFETIWLSIHICLNTIDGGITSTMMRKSYLITIL